MPVHLTPGPTSVGPQKCAVESCPDGVVRDGCCALHAVEADSVELAHYIIEQLEHHSGSLEHATRASRALMERLAVLAACRDAIARAATAPSVEVAND